jgi:hypothetical protein
VNGLLTVTTIRAADNVITLTARYEPSSVIEFDEQLLKLLVGVLDPVTFATNHPKKIVCSGIQFWAVWQIC